MAGVKLTVGTTPEMKAELHTEARRLNCTVSRVIILAWDLARERVKKYPDGNGRLG